jgi:serine/threonine protein kinase
MDAKDFLDRGVRGVDIFTRLQHPNLINLLGYDIRGTRFFPSMEGDGENMPIESTVSNPSLYEVLCAIAFLHSNDVVHGSVSEGRMGQVRSREARRN